MAKKKKKFGLVRKLLFLVALIAIGFAFTSEYGKSLLFPDKKEMFFKELSDWEFRNKNKTPKTLISERPITKEPFRTYEVALRKEKNLKAKFHNKYGKILDDCSQVMKNRDQHLPIDTFKKKMQHCYSQALLIKDEALKAHKEALALFENLEGTSQAISKIKKARQIDKRLFKKIISLYQILATRDYKIKRGEFIFSQERDLSEFRKKLQDLALFLKEYKDFEVTRGLASLKESGDSRLTVESALKNALTFLE